MIVLYVVMLRATAVRSEDLFNDVIKAQNFLQSMQEVTVALRSAQLLREGLEIARSSSRRDVAIPVPPDVTGQANGGPRTQAEGSDFTPNPDQHTSQTNFGTNEYGSNPGPLFASLIDPALLQDFTAGMTTLADLVTSDFIFDNLYSDGPGVNMTSTLFW
jgi:hypothetical protein